MTVLARRAVALPGLAPDGRRWTDVVAAVIYRPDGSYLLAQRPAGKAYAGYWEFPGGKVEPGESLDAAIKREILEELGIEVLIACPWLVRTHLYEHAAVRLHFFRVRQWRGAPEGREAQQFAFQVPGAETVAPMLPANGPILAAVGLPAVMGITNAAELGVDVFMQRLEAAFTKGLRLVQVREKDMAPAGFLSFAQQVVARCKAHGARVLINGAAELAEQCGAHGVHLTSAQLMQTTARPVFGPAGVPVGSPTHSLVGASVHSRAQLDHAVAIGCDYVLLGPVLPTRSHPGAATLGWHGFGEIASAAPIPVYALGGMHGTHVYPTAWQAGAHGVAMLRGAWE